MRIACLHIPQLSLQCATRIDPSLRGAPVAVVGAAERGPRVLGAPIVLACSRAAWALGVRLGMTATSARALSPALVIVTADPVAERETARAIADALLGVTATVEIGGRVGAGAAHLAVYAEVPTARAKGRPTGWRGQAFGERALELIGALGLTGRVGIADDRFTAWVAAAYGADKHVHDGDEDGVVVVPRGGSAAFLAPRPLALLAIPLEVQHMLEALGVTTLGQFAALPAPSVARPFEADYQALARGDSGSALRPYTPDGPIREELLVRSGNVLDSASGVSGPAAIATIARRIELRLAGRGRTAARLDVRAGERELPIELASPIGEAEALARVLAPAIGESGGAWRLIVHVAGEALAGDERTVADHGASRAAEAVTTDPLAVVLATAGSLDLRPWALSPDVRAERRDVHRRTRRGKQRRTRPTPSAQSRLFERG
ncbi:MAG TPA: hypothetical protein VMJ10_07935 [Kofleriaceae bacterium]|nr:hypothetical protein [Kofleriaceae bacterium]